MRIATVCPASSPLFVGLVEDVFRDAGHEVRRFGVSSPLDADGWGDVVWCDWPRSWGVRLSHEGTKPLVVRILGYEVWEPELRAIQWARVEHVVYSCRFHYAAALRGAPEMAAVPATQIASPLDFDRFALQPHGTGPRLGMMGQKDARKNLFGALQVLAALPERYSLDVGGECEDPRLADYIDHAIGAMGLRDRVRFRGRVEDTVEFWRELDYCLVPSTSDQGPRSLAEAMALGVMPVVHDYPGARDRVPDGCVWTTVADAALIIERGYFAPPAYWRRFVHEGRNNPEAIRAALLRVISGNRGSRHAPREERR